MALNLMICKKDSDIHLYQQNSKEIFALRDDAIMV